MNAHVAIRARTSVETVASELLELNAHQSSHTILATALRAADLLRELEAENARLRAGYSGSAAIPL
jgi:hypothetical protein